jgi:hypothetical protein
MVLIGGPVEAYDRTPEDRKTKLMTRKQARAPDPEPGAQSSEGCRESADHSEQQDRINSDGGFRINPGGRITDQFVDPSARAGISPVRCRYSVGPSGGMGTSLRTIFAGGEPKRKAPKSTRETRDPETSVGIQERKGMDGGPVPRSPRHRFC